MASSAATKLPFQRLLVLGGNGYVGQNLCHAALESGKFASVASMSRSGRPRTEMAASHLHSSLEKVDWRKGDVWDEGARKDLMQDCDVIVSTIGAFGSNEFMEKICGDANVAAMETAASLGTVQRFGFVSSAQVGRLDLSAPFVPLKGYYVGKQKAEDALRQAFPDAHVILRPGFIYGNRPTPLGMTFPLQAVGIPMTMVGTQLGPISSAIQSLPFVGTEAASAVSVEAVREAMIQSISSDQLASSPKILFPGDIRKFE